MTGSDKWEGFRKDDPPAGITAEELPEYLREHGNEFLGPRPFAAYMRAKFREKGVLQQNVFLAADLSENYGYKLIAEEKHTVGRDTILRVCLAARFDTDETREALLLYGMAPLYGAFARDAVIIAAIRSGLYDIHAVSELLVRCGQAPLSGVSG